MRSASGVRQGIFVLAVMAATGCASTAGPIKPASGSAADGAPPPDPAIARSSDEFTIGREAALGGDFECARYHFQLSVDAVQPAGAPAAEGTRLAFSFDLYEGIQRYEALAGATEEAGTSHGQVAPELAGIEAPAATPEEISNARAEVASSLPTVSSDVPIVVNDSVLRVIAAFQSDALHDKIAAGLSRSGRYVPMIEETSPRKAFRATSPGSLSSNPRFCRTPVLRARPRESGSSCRGPAGSTG